MKRNIINVLFALVLALSFSLLTATPARAAARVASVTGVWSSTATWGGLSVPTSADDVTINAGITVTVDVANAACSTLANQASNGTATLTFNSGSQLTIGTTLTVGANNAARMLAINMTSGGTLQLGGTVTIRQTGGAWTPGTGTVEYNAAGVQTVEATWMTTYNNLTLSGSGAKTTTGATVTGILSIEGTATIGGTLPTWSGTAYTLQYKTTDVRTVGTEWAATFGGTGGVIIANTSGSLTLNGAKVFNASVPLTINSGATLNTSAANNYQLTFGGNFVNSGGTLTANASPIIIADTMVTQSIGGFTTTGGLTVTKTSGTATLQSAVSPGALTMNGSGGTLNLGSGLTHTVSSVTLTNGTLDGGSSTMNVTGNWGGTGGTFTASTGTVGFTGGSAQSITGSRTFNNLTLNNSSGLTINNDETVNGTLTFTNGKITTGANTVIMGTSGSVSGANSSRYVIGNLRKYVDSTATRTFEVGGTVSYNSVAVTFASVAVAGNLTAKATSGDSSSIGTSRVAEDKSVNVYWSLTNSGIVFTSYSAVFNFNNPGDLDASANTANFIVGKLNGTWTYPTVGTKTSTSTQVTGVTSFSDFQLGEAKGWESYESDYTTVRNNYNNTYNTVYMKGTGFTQGTYNVAFYDGGASGGQKVTTVTDIIVGVDNILQTSLYLGDKSSSTLGTWHAVVQPTGGTAFPQDYNTVIGAPDTYVLITTDSFDVEASAIPEFPDVIAGIAVAGMCFGIYWKMRKRVRRVHGVC